MRTGGQPVLELPEVEAPDVVTSRLGRFAYALLGFVFLGIGIMGIITPGMPGTVFLLVATALFFKSNERMYLWVMNHPRFGTTVRAYRAGYGMPRRIKVYAISVMCVSVAAAVLFAIDSNALRVFLVALAFVGAVFIYTRPTTETVLAEA